MGDPKFPRRRFDTPSHPWQADRIAAEKTLVKKYGLKNKREVWKATSNLRRMRQTARQLLAKQALPTDQSQRETGQLIMRLARYGIVREGSTLDDVLALNVENVLARRLQTVVYLKGLAGTPDQARQFITHGHIWVGDRRVTIPSYLVSREDESAIQFDPTSPVADETHPVRPKVRVEESAPAPRRGTGRPERGERRGPRRERPAGGAEAPGEPGSATAGEVPQPEAAEEAGKAPGAAEGPKKAPEAGGKPEKAPAASEKAPVAKETSAKKEPAEAGHEGGDE